jgi:hypothetical protein
MPPPLPLGSPPPDQNRSAPERAAPRRYPPGYIAGPPPSPPSLNMLRVGVPGAQPGATLGAAHGQIGQSTAGQQPMNAFATWWPWPAPQLRGAIEQQVHGIPFLFLQLWAERLFLCLLSRHSCVPHAFSRSSLDSTLGRTLSSLYWIVHGRVAGSSVVPTVPIEPVCFAMTPSQSSE